jgi:large repetitive protein
MKGRIAAGLTAGALSLFSGGVVGHALSISSTALTSATNPSIWGQSVTFTATITPVAPAPTGTVTFQDAGINIAGCVNRAVAARVATCVTAALGVGSHAITALYNGNATYATSTSAPVTQVVNMGSTSTVVAASANPSVSGQTVTYTATVSVVAPAAGARTGTVDFQDGGVDIPGCSARAVAAAGTATCAIAYGGPGVHTITAIYSGDANFTSSTAAPLTQSANVGATAVALTSSANPSGTGQNVTFTANVTATAPASGARTGTVDFQAGGVNIPGCSAQVVPASGKATCVTNTLPVGVNTITAIYSGDSNFATSTSVPFVQTVNQGATTTKVVSSLNPASTGVIVTFTATVTASAPASGARTGTVAFQDGGVAIAGCAVQVLSAAGTATCATNALTAGAHSITAVYSGDGNFTTSTSPVLTETVVSATATTVVSSANPSVFGQAIQYTATVAGGPVVTGTVTFRDGGSNIAGCVAVLLSAGSASCAVSPTVAAHNITAVYSGDASNAASTSAVMTQVVGADPTTTSLTATVSPTVFGQSVTFTATVTANAPGSGTPTGKVAFDNGAAAIAGCGAVALVGGVATCTTTALTVGVHAIRALYGGSPNYVASTSAILTQTVNPGATTTVVGSSVNPSVSGQTVTYTATVTLVAPAAGVPTGKVNFEDGGVTIAGCGAKAIAAAGTATCAFTYGGAGIHVITAIYTGDVNFAGSTSPAFTQNVNQASTSTAVASSVNPSVTGQALIITGTVNVIAPGTGIRTGTVMFQDGGATITGCAAVAVSAAGTAACAASFATAGAHSITAVYSGDANFSGSTSAVLGETVNQGATTTLVSSSVNPSEPGQTLTYTAIVAANAPAGGTPTGTVTFMDGAAPIAGCIAQPTLGGVASCGATYAGVGAHAITAVYTGDANFNGSTSSLLTQTITQGATAAGLISSVNPSVSGEGLTYTVTVTAVVPASGIPAGSAEFLDGASPIAACIAQPLVAGVTSCNVSYAGAGVHAITAVYVGDVNFTTSTSSVLTQTVNPGATSALVTSTVNPSVSGQSVSYIAAVTALAPASGVPTGTVSFLDGATTIGGCTAQPLVGGVASCSVAYPGAGSHAITAVYGGDPDFTASSSPVLTQTVNPASTSTSLASSVNPSATGQPVTITATVSVTAPGSGTPTGTVAFLDGGATVTGCGAQLVTVAGAATCATTFIAVGADTITAIYSGDADFNGSTSAVLTQVVNQGATATLISSSVNPSVSGEATTYTAAMIAVAPAAGIPTGSVEFLDGASPIAGCVAQPLVAGIASCAVTYPGVGSHAITAIYSGDPDFLGSTSALLQQTVSPASTSTSLTSSVNPSVTGQPVTITATVTVAAPGSGTPTGSVAFLDGGTTITGCAAQGVTAAGIAICTTVFVAGADAITAVYSGDADFNTSTSPSLTQTINLGATASTVTSSVNPALPGQPLSYAVAVSAVAPAAGTPTGSVAFVDGSSTVAGCAAQPLVAGVAWCGAIYVIAGVHTITAVYAGDPNFAASTSPGLTQTVVAAASATTVTSPARTWVSGRTGIFEATVSPAGPAAVTPTGTAAFMDAGAAIPGCAARPVVAGAASCSVVYTGAGTHPITAVYSGDAALLGSTSTTFVVSVYEDPPTPDAGAGATDGPSLAYLAILGGVVLVFIAGCVRLRRRDVDRH